MAISIQLNVPNALTAIATAAGCPAWGVQLDALGVVIDLMPKAISLRYQSSIVANTLVNTSAVKLLLDDSLQAASKNILSEKLCAMYEKAVDSLHQQGVIVTKCAKDADLLVPEKTGAQSAALKKSKGSGGKPPHVTHPLKEPAASSKAVTGEPLLLDPVPLLTATAIGQPVTASTGGSVYHVVALANGLAAAARILVTGTNWKLSLRFEGANLPLHNDALASVGASGKGGHYSLHLQGEGGGGMALRAMGAALMGADFGWSSLVTSGNALINMGS